MVEGAHVERLYQGCAWAEGPVWFADPDYGLMDENGVVSGENNLSGCYVFRVSADLNEVACVADSGFSNDKEAPHHIRALDLSADGQLVNTRIFADISPGVPEVVANLTFGGPHKNKIFITATASLYVVEVGISGAQRP